MLKILEIDNCPHISDKAVRRCIRRLSLLEEIDIFDCPAVHQRAEEREDKKENPPNLRVKYFNRDEENSRVLSTTPDMHHGKQCVIL